MSSCYPNKGERERSIEGVFHFHHPPFICAQSWSTYLICHLHGSIVWFCNICDTSACFYFHLPLAPHKLSLEVGWKQAILWWWYIHNERHERSYGEVKLWLVSTKIFSKSQSYSRKVEETEVSTIPLFNFPNIMVDTSNSQVRVKLRIIYMQVSYHIETGSALDLAFNQGRAKNQVWGILLTVINNPF